MVTAGTTSLTRAGGLTISSETLLALAALYIVCGVTGVELLFPMRQMYYNLPVPKTDIRSSTNWWRFCGIARALIGEEVVPKGEAKGASFVTQHHQSCPHWHRHFFPLNYRIWQTSSAG